MKALYIYGTNQEKKLIGQANTWKDAMSQMHTFLEENSYLKSYYTRLWVTPLESKWTLEIDFGSWSEFCSIESFDSPEDAIAWVQANTIDNN